MRRRSLCCILEGESRGCHGRPDFVKANRRHPAACCRAKQYRLVMNNVVKCEQDVLAFEMLCFQKVPDHDLGRSSLTKALSAGRASMQQDS